MERTQAINAATNQTPYKMRRFTRQLSGQRIYRNCWNEAEVYFPPGCELFVTHLPQDALEEELIPLFASFGELHEVRIMISPSGHSRGFCYVTYNHKETAEYAMRHLHGFRIRPVGEPIACYPSIDNRRLYLEGLPIDKPLHRIKRAIKEEMIGVHKIILYTPEQEYAVPGSAFVEFLTHRYAVDNRRRYPLDIVSILGARVNIEWAVPVPSHNRNNIILLKNLPHGLHRMSLLRRLVRVLPRRVGILNVFKRRSYAVVRFVQETDAALASCILKDHKISGQEIIVEQFDFNQDGEVKLMAELQICAKGNIRLPFALFPCRQNPRERGRRAENPRNSNNSNDNGDNN